MNRRSRSALETADNRNSIKSNAKLGYLGFVVPGLQNCARECFNQIIETGVLHEVGLRNTLEPDPDNTGVGSFRSRSAFFL